VRRQDAVVVRDQDEWTRHRDTKRKRGRPLGVAVRSRRGDWI
jgi:hypothetical protein